MHSPIRRYEIVGSWIHGVHSELPLMATLEIRNERKKCYDDKIKIQKSLFLYLQAMQVHRVLPCTNIVHGSPRLCPYVAPVVAGCVVWPWYVTGPSCAVSFDTHRGTLPLLSYLSCLPQTQQPRVRKRLAPTLPCVRFAEFQDPAEAPFRQGKPPCATCAQTVHRRLSAIAPNAQPFKSSVGLRNHVHGPSRECTLLRPRSSGNAYPLKSCRSVGAGRRFASLSPMIEADLKDLRVGNACPLCDRNQGPARHGCSYGETRSGTHAGCECRMAARRDPKPASITGTSRGLCSPSLS